MSKFKGSNVRDFASSICSGKNYLQSSQASSILFGGPLSDPTNSGSQPSGFDSPERRESRKSFQGKAEDIVYEIDRSLKERKEEKKAMSPVVN